MLEIQDTLSQVSRWEIDYSIDELQGTKLLTMVQAQTHLNEQACQVADYLPYLTIPASTISLCASTVLPVRPPMLYRIPSSAKVLCTGAAQDNASINHNLVTTLSQQRLSSEGTG